MKKTWQTPELQALISAVLALRMPDEAQRFLRDLLTEEELAEFGRRWQAARMLRARLPYTAIVRATGLSSTTVARVAKWLNGPLGGYRLVLARLGHHSAAKRFPHKSV